MRALFIGLGGIGQRHLRILKAIEPNVSIAAVRIRNRSFEIGDDLKVNTEVDINTKYKISIYPNIEDSLKFKPDFAIVSNPTSLHVNTCTELVKNKIPVLLEKPVSHNIDGIEELLNTIKEKNTPVMVGYMMRFHPCSIKLKEMIDKKIIDKIYSVVLIINSFMPKWHEYENYNEFYAGMKSLGGGVVLTEIHEIDLLSWYFGKPSHLFSIGGKLSNFNIDVEDTAGVVMEQNFNDYKFPINISMSFVELVPYRKMILFGESGNIEWDITASEIIVNNKTNNSEEIFKTPDFQRNEMFSKQLEHFIDCINNKKEPITSLNKVIDSHLTALSIKKSLKNNSIVDIISL